MSEPRKHETRVQGYLKPGQHKFITDYANTYGMTESKAVAQAVKALQDTLPAEVKEKISSSKNSY